LNDDRHVSFLLPVDSFQELIFGAGDSLEDHLQRGDLLACQIRLPDASTMMTISIVTIECKYSSGVFPASFVPSAINQAKETTSRVKRLAEAGLATAAERLAFLNLVSFGMRLNASGRQQPLDIDEQVLSCILAGRYVIAQPAAEAVLVSTECGITSPDLKVDSLGWWIRLCPGHWPLNVGP
jgi:hypothetical protein